MFIQDTAGNFDKTETTLEERAASSLEDGVAANWRRLWIKFWDLTESGKEADTSSFNGIL